MMGVSRQAQPGSSAGALQAAGPGSTAVAWPALGAELRPCLALVGLVYGALVLAWQGAQVPYLGTVLMAAAVWAQLWLPVMRADRTHVPVHCLGLHRRALGEELRVASLVAVALLVPWVAGVLWSGHFDSSAWAGPWTQRWAPLQVADFILTQVLGVALPEEVFWRGYVMQVLAARWPRRWLGLASGAWLSAALFALGHLAQTPSLARLGTFFPGLVFCWLVQRRRSLIGAWFFHALCNLVSAALGARL